VGRTRNKRGEGETVAVALILAVVGGASATTLHITAAGAQDEQGGGRNDARVGGVPVGCSFDPPDAKASRPSRWTAGDDSQRLGRC
jgi:hypothetical protein